LDALEAREIDIAMLPTTYYESLTNKSPYKVIEPWELNEPKGSFGNAWHFVDQISLAGWNTSPIEFYNAINNCVELSITFMLDEPSSGNDISGELIEKLWSVYIMEDNSSIWHKVGHARAAAHKYEWSNPNRFKFTAANVKKIAIVPLEAINLNGGWNIEIETAAWVTR
jgi:hypothetical protein